MSNNNGNTNTGTISTVNDKLQCQTIYDDNDVADDFDDLDAAAATLCSCATSCTRLSVMTLGAACC